MLYLNEKSVLELAECDEIISSVEEAFAIHNSGNYIMPDRFHIERENNVNLYMPCFLNESFGTKIITVWPENRKLNKPVVDGVMILNDSETGGIRAIIDAKSLTAIRTGAVGAVGAKYLSNVGIKRLGIVGAGVQGLYQAVYITKVRKISEIIVYDPFLVDLMDFKKRFFDLGGSRKIDIIRVDDIDELMIRSEIIVTATTSKKPVLPANSNMLKGKCFIGIGSYREDMREYPDEIFSLIDNIYVDLLLAAKESGDLVIPQKKGLLKDKTIKTLGEYINNPNEKSDETVFFKSVGMALFDLVVAEKVYNLYLRSDKNDKNL